MKHMPLALRRCQAPRSAAQQTAGLVKRSLIRLRVSRRLRRSFASAPVTRGSCALCYSDATLTVIGLRLKILLIRLRLIGDVVLTTPAVRAIRQAFPDAQLTYVVERYAAPVVQHNPHLDRVLLIPPATGWPRLVQDFTLAQQIRHERFDMVVDFHGGPRASWLAWASGAPVRIGYAVKGRSWMYTTVVPRPRELRPRHSVENQWDLLPWISPALARPADPARDRVEMREAPGAADALAHRLAALGVSE